MYDVFRLSCSLLMHMMYVDELCFVLGFVLFTLYEHVDG